MRHVIRHLRARMGRSCAFGGRGEGPGRRRRLASRASIATTACRSSPRCIEPPPPFPAPRPLTRWCSVVLHSDAVFSATGTRTGAEPRRVDRVPAERARLIQRGAREAPARLLCGRRARRVELRHQRGPSPSPSSRLPRVCPSSSVVSRPCRVRRVSRRDRPFFFLVVFAAASATARRSRLSSVSRRADNHRVSRHHKRGRGRGSNETTTHPPSTPTRGRLVSTQ